MSDTPLWYDRSGFCKMCFIAYISYTLCRSIWIAVVFCADSDKQLEFQNSDSLALEVLALARAANLLSIPTTFTSTHHNLIPSFMQCVFLLISRNNNANCHRHMIIMTCAQSRIRRKRLLYHYSFNFNRYLLFMNCVSNINDIDLIQSDQHTSSTSACNNSCIVAKSTSKHEAPRYRLRKETLETSLRDYTTETDFATCVSSYTFLPTLCRSLSYRHGGLSMLLYVVGCRIATATRLVWNVNKCIIRHKLLSMPQVTLFQSKTIIYQ